MTSKRRSPGTDPSGAEHLRSRSAQKHRTPQSDERSAQQLKGWQDPACIATPEAGLNEEPLRWLLGYQIAQASIVTIGNYQQVAGLRHDLRPVEYTMLVLIQANPGAAPAQLAKALTLSAPYVTTGIDKLCRRGLVRRESNANDARKQHLVATEAGEALAAEMTKTVIDNELARFKTLSLAEHYMLAELLHKLALARTLVLNREQPA